MMRTRLAEEVRELEQELHARFGVNAAAFDAAGARVTGFVAWSNPLCKALKGNPASASAICAVANSHFMRQARHTREPVTGECDAGFLKFCVPVFSGEEFQGVVGGCGCLACGAAVDAFAVGKASGLSGGEISELAAACREMSDEALTQAIGFLRGEVHRLVAGV